MAVPPPAARINFSFVFDVTSIVLKAELDFLLGRYENIKFQDADYQKYGLGATEVYFIQKKML